MSRRCEPGLRPAFDRPLLRLAWVVPASLCLWVMVLAGFSILHFIAYIKDELLIVLGTSSSETVLPQLMHKMVRLGASEPVVGLV